MIAVEMEDSRGKPTLYRVAACERGSDIWACEFSHEQGKKKPKTLTYRVSVGLVAGKVVWACQCPARSRWRTGRHCKHINKAKELRRLGMGDTTNSAIAEALAAPFDPKEVKWKPQTVSGNRAMATCYIDSRCVQDRLDDVVGVTGWEDSYEFLPSGSVYCRLKVKIGDEWRTKGDVGSPSEQPDEGDRVKAAVSDALKRAAVKFGIGRYLYSIGRQWVDYDPQKKRFVKEPTLPAWALPKAQPATAPQPRPVPANGATAKPTVAASLRAADAWAHAHGYSEEGELIAYCVRDLQNFFGDNIDQWGEDSRADVKALVTHFNDRAKAVKAQEAGE